VTDYSKWRGFGHISVDQKGVLPGDTIFVHWKNIQTEDRFPRLYQGLQVEFGAMISREWKGWKKVRSLKAKTVTLPGGAQVNIQDAMDAEKKQFVVSQTARFTGNLKFFDSMKGFGWVTVDDGFAFPEEVPKEIKVEGTEINFGGRPPRHRLEQLAVEFGIVKNKKGDAYLVYNMTLPGGLPLKQEKMENRQELPGQTFAGTIAWYNWRQGWGHILPDPGMQLPPVVAEKLEENLVAAQAKAKADSDKVPEKLLYFRKSDCEWGEKLEVGNKVTYSLYVDDKGAGACGVVLQDAP